jgi:cytochrome c oxidase subunit IV
MTAEALEHDTLARPTSYARNRLLIWIVLSAVAALVAYFGFRGYLNPELLFHFANALYC